MKKLIIFTYICLLNTSVLGFNIIPLDDALSSHQKAFKDFEQYAPYCKVNISKYDTYDAHVTETNYEFPSLQAKISFENYKKTLEKLKGLIYINSILKGLTLGFSERCLGNFFNTNLSNKQVLGINSLASMAIVFNEVVDKKEEPYFNKGTLTKSSNLFGLKSADIFIRTFVTLFTIECARAIGK